MPIFRKFFSLNWFFIINIVIILAIGVSGIYSATYFREDGDALQMLWEKQIYWIGIGFCGFFVVSLVDYKWARYLAVPFYFFSLGLLLLLHFGPDSIVFKKESARSWLKLGSNLTFQPSQVAIFAGIIIIAYVLATFPRNKHLFKKFPFLTIILVGLVAFIPFILVLKESDLGSASVWCPVVLIMMIAAGIPYRYLIMIVLGGLMILPLVYFFVLKDYQKTRITTWIRMIEDKPVNKRDEAYAINNNLIAIGSAGVMGKGFKAKKTMTKLNFIPKDVAISDYIFVVLAEEHGFKGIIILLLCYGCLLIQILLVAFYSRDHLGLIICSGIAGLLFAHMFQNIGMSLLLIPITGIPLPLVSYGGTFVCIILTMLGLVQSIWVHKKTTISVIDIKK